MEEKVGAYVLDENGDMIPDLNDEAMSKRYNLKKTFKKKDKEVKEDAVRKQSTDIG